MPAMHKALMVSQHSRRAPPFHWGVTISLDPVDQVHFNHVTSRHYSHYTLRKKKLVGQVTGVTGYQKLERWFKTTKTNLMILIMKTMDKQTFKNCCLKWWTHLLSLKFLDPGGSGKYWLSHSSQDEANPTLRQGPRRISGMVSPAVPTSSIIFHQIPLWSVEWGPAMSSHRSTLKPGALLHIFAGYLRPPLLHWDPRELPVFQQKMGVNVCGTHWETTECWQRFHTRKSLARKSSHF